VPDGLTAKRIVSAVDAELVTKGLSNTEADTADLYIVRSDDKKRARLNCISHLLSILPSERKPVKKYEVGKRMCSWVQYMSLHTLAQIH
jgi:Polyphosphate kinase 2 (PPK2)